VREEKDMNKHLLLYKALVIGIFVLFIGAGITPVIGEDFSNEQEVSSLTFYTFGRSGTKKCKVELESDVIEDISVMFEELKNMLACDPTSDSIQKLKVDFVDLLDKNNLIPKGLCKDNVVSLLSPRWLDWFDGNNPFYRNNYLSSLGSRLENSFVPGSFPHTGSAFFCSLAGGGFGLMFPPVMIPRPRIATVWSSFLNADTIAANLYTGHGFSASGPQFGVALGFLGVGLSFAIPGQPAYFGFGGYALYTMVGAEEITTYPLNRAPVVSEESPKNGQMSVPLSLSELSFRISDADGDRMSYWVTTDPDIGSGEGHFKTDGRYSVSVSGLEPDKSYSWTVRVSDGESTVVKSFGFTSVEGPPFDPFDEGWQYRKKVTVDHSLVAGDQYVFPIVVNIVDSDLKNKAQNDGDDILFMDDSGVANKLYHEFEKYDSDTGTLVVWVGLPELYGSSDTDFYMYYGNPTCSNNENSIGVWDGYFEAVWHMSDYGNQIDSTGNGHTLFPAKAPEYQKEASIGYSCYFDGFNDEYLEGSAVVTNYPVTSEAYGIIDYNVESMIPVAMCDYSGYDVLSGIYFRSSNADDKLRAYSRDNSGQPNTWATTTNTYTLNIPQYMVARHSSKSFREAC